MSELLMSPKDYKHFQRVAQRIKALLEKNEVVLLADYLREFNAAQSKKKKIAFSTAAQACREGRIPGVLIGKRNWLVPKGAILAAREAGLLTGKRGRPDQGRYWQGECPDCGRMIHGTSQKKTVKHYPADVEYCAGEGRQVESGYTADGQFKGDCPVCGKVLKVGKHYKTPRHLPEGVEYCSGQGKPLLHAEEAEE